MIEDRMIEDALENSNIMDPLDEVLNPQNEDDYYEDIRFPEELYDDPTRNARTIERTVQPMMYRQLQPNEIQVTEFFEQVPEFFPNTRIEFKDRVTVSLFDDGGVILQFNIVVYVSDTENLCFYISGLYKGIYSGTDLLERLELLARRFGVRFMMLEDKSSKPIRVGEESYNLNLGHLLIMALGGSWYNRLGFYQPNYATEFEYWSYIRARNLSFNSVRPIIENLTYDQWLQRAKHEWFEDPIVFLLRMDDEDLDAEDVDEEEFIQTMTRAIEFVEVEMASITSLPIVTIAGTFYLRIKTSSVTTMDEFTRILVYVGLCSYVYPYTRTQMVKELV
jgi:hypothetical protein